MALVLMATLLGCSDSLTSAAGERPKIPSYISAAHWTHPIEGYRLHVTPSIYGRNHALDNPGRALTEAVGAAGKPPLRLTARVRDSLTKQLRCHAEFAATKPEWDLETWRPDVSYQAFVYALCNPGRP
jgi:hypothetical protein